MAAEFPQGGECFRSKFRAITCSFRFMLIPLFIVVIGAVVVEQITIFIFASRGVFVVVIVFKACSHNFLSDYLISVALGFI